MTLEKLQAFIAEGDFYEPEEEHYSEVEISNYTAAAINQLLQDEQVPR